MLPSIAQSKNSINEKHPFGVLLAQEEPEEAVKKSGVPVRFEDMKKPTELEPIGPVVEQVKGNKIDTLDKMVSEMIVPGWIVPNDVEKKDAVLQKFKVPSELTGYISKLLSSGRKLRVLQFDIEESVSEEAVAEVIDSKFTKGMINEKEKSEMLSLLKEHSGSRDLLPETSRGARIKANNLKRNHGIVLHDVSGSLTKLESGIIDKSVKLWKGGGNEVAVSTALIEGDYGDLWEVEQAA